MRKWEDIIKDKMEEPEGALPESVFAEFCARREAAAAAPAKKRFPPVWAVAPAVAAGLAAVLLLHKPSVPEGDIQIIQQPLTPVAVVTDSTTVAEPWQTTPLIAQVVTPKVARQAVVKPQEVEIVENVEPAEEDTATTIDDKATQADVPQTDMPDTIDKETPDRPITTTTSPFIPERTKATPVKMKVGPAAGMIVGGGLLAAIIPPIPGAGTEMDNAPMADSDKSGGTVVLTPDPPKDERIGNADHYFPLKMGLSVRFPLNDRLSFTTGLNYSRYRSSFTYSLSGEKIQNAHYLGIPVRLDWTLASNKWLDIYVGGGFEGDFCLGATLAGERIAKDAFCASLLGAGGIQFNLTKRFGVYVEPALSCTITPENPVPETYRTKHPLMFSVSSGLRITIEH